MSGQSLKDLKEALDAFLEEKEDVLPGDPLFILIIYAEGLRDATEYVIRVAREKGWEKVLKG